MPDDREARYQRTLQQYRDYPMPIRSAEEDERGDYVRPGDNHAAIRSLVFGGRDVFAGDARILVAGGGTGDSTLYFAKLIRDLGGTGSVVHLDQSPAANRICRERLDRFGLDNVDIDERSIYELDATVDGQFDYVNCNGVLHHLSDPDEGLRRLASVTRDDGGLGIWIYAKYGRAGLYHMQRMLLDLVGDRPIDGEAIELSKAIVAELPGSSLGRFDGAGNLASLTRSSSMDRHGEQYADRFLISTDQPYSAREMFEFVERAGLEFTAFQRPVEALMYDPLNFVRAPAAREILAGKRFRDRAEFAERWHCKLNMHRIYLAKTAAPMVSDRGRVLAWRQRNASPRDLGPQRTQVLEMNGMKLPVLINEASVALLSALDGTSTTGTLIDRHGIDEQAIAADEHKLRIAVTMGAIEVLPAAATGCA